MNTPHVARTDDADAGPMRLRALAHPLRQKMLDILAGRQLRVTDCAVELGASTAAVSHHMRILDKYGFIEVVRVGVGREKFWTAREVSVPLEDLRQDPDAAGVVSTHMLGRHHHHLRAYWDAAVDGRFSRSWTDASAIVELGAFLTPLELSQLNQELGDVAERWMSGRAKKRTRAARQVYIQYAAFPSINEGQ